MEGFGTLVSMKSCIREKAAETLWRVGGSQGCVLVPVSHCLHSLLRLSFPFLCPLLNSILEAPSQSNQGVWGTGAALRGCCCRGVSRRQSWGLQVVAGDVPEVPAGEFPSGCSSGHSSRAGRVLGWPCEGAGHFQVIHSPGSPCSTGAVPALWWVGGCWSKIPPVPCELLVPVTPQECPLHQGWSSVLSEGNKESPGPAGLGWWQQRGFFEGPGHVHKALLSLAGLCQFLADWKTAAPTNILA